jgi:hypothetical protein
MRVQAADTVGLDAHELEAVSGGSPISYAIGYTIGFLARLIVNADPFDGNYYGVGA